jgi:uroporphyrinogen-III synthase
MQPKQSRFRMSDPIATLILTRPRAASERFLEQMAGVVSSRVGVLISPLLDIVPTGAVPELDGVRGVIFTSTNGVAFAGAGHGIKAYCVGPATLAAARAAGWDAKLSGSTAEELVSA